MNLAGIAHQQVEKALQKQVSLRHHATVCMLLTNNDASHCSEALGFEHLPRVHVMRASSHSVCVQYYSRKLIKRDMRSLWITRLNAATREHGLKYGDFIHGMNLASIERE